MPGWSPERFVEERSSGAWFRFRCVRAAHKTWVLLLAPAAGAADGDPKDFDRAEWNGARMFLETRIATDGSVEECRPVGRFDAGLAVAMALKTREAVLCATKDDDRMQFRVRQVRDRDGWLTCVFETSVDGQSWSALSQRLLPLGWITNTIEGFWPPPACVSAAVVDGQPSVVFTSVLHDSSGVRYHRAVYWERWGAWSTQRIR